MSNNNEKKLNGTVIVTYRCNARCSMCNRYKAPSKPEEEISIETIKKLPKMYFTNITGGEPFIRTDLKDIVRELYKKSDRIVISTNGFFTDRIVDLCKEFPQIGIRISIEGLEQTNNEIRGLQNGYQRGYGTLKKLREMGMKDVGFGMTVQDVIGWQAFYGLLYAFYCRLFHVKKVNTLLIKNFTYKPKKGLTGKIYFRFMNYIVKSKYVDVFVCTSQTFCDYCAKVFDEPSDRFVFLPFGVNDFTKKVNMTQPASNDYILSLGRSNRDWDFLIC